MTQHATLLLREMTRSSSPEKDESRKSGRVPDSTAEDSTAEDSTAELYLTKTLWRGFS